MRAKNLLWISSDESLPPHHLGMRSQGQGLALSNSVVWQPGWKFGVSFIAAFFQPSWDVNPITHRVACVLERQEPPWTKGWTGEMEEDVSVPRMLKSYVLWDKIRYQWCILFIKGLVCGLGHTQPFILFSCFLTLLVHVGPRCLGCRFHHPRNTPALPFAVLKQILAWQQFPWSASKQHSPQQEKPEDCYQIRRLGCWLGQQRYRGKVKDSFQIHQLLWRGLK